MFKLTKKQKEIIKKARKNLYFNDFKFFAEDI